MFEVCSFTLNQHTTQNEFPSSSGLTVERCRDLGHSPRPGLLKGLIFNITLRQGATAHAVLQITPAIAATI
jgi:hypothetical protein